MKNKVLITGGAGFIGSQTVHYLWSRGYDVYLMDNFSYGHEDNLEFLNIKFQCKRLDILHRDFDDYVKNIEPNIILHFAGIAPLPVCQADPALAIRNNVEGTARVFEAARKYGAAKVVFASTSAIYENTVCPRWGYCETQKVCPDLIYPTTKLAAEEVCKAFFDSYGINTTILRFFNVYGPHQDFRRKSPPLLGYITKCLLKDEEAVLHSDGHQRRDYIYVEDLCWLIFKVMNTQEHNSLDNTYNACSGGTVSVRDLVELMENSFGKKLKVKYRDSSLFWDDYPSLQSGKYILSKERLEKEVTKFSLGDFSKAANKFNWRPSTSIEEGISKVIDYARP